MQILERFEPSKKFYFAALLLILICFAYLVVVGQTIFLTKKENTEPFNIIEKKIESGQPGTIAVLGENGETIFLPLKEGSND